jgi:hypothetical protein
LRDDHLIGSTLLNLGVFGVVDGAPLAATLVDGTTGAELAEDGTTVLGCAIGCATLVDGWRGAADCDAAALVGDGATGCATLVNGDMAADAGAILGVSGTQGVADAAALCMGDRDGDGREEEDTLVDGEMGALDAIWLGATF